MKEITVQIIFNKDTTAKEAQDVFLKDIQDALHLSADDPKRLEELRQIAINLRWGIDNLLAKCAMPVTMRQKKVESILEEAA